jgi:hypothetical protein
MGNQRRQPFGFEASAKNTHRVGIKPLNWRQESVNSMLRIDSHTHILPREMPRWTERFGAGNYIHLEDSPRKGFARMMPGNRFFRDR